jgi:hypothetical protein
METALVSTDPAPADLVATDVTPPDLTYLNGFASEDLAQNRDGRLSDNQRGELRRAARDEVGGGAILLAFAIFGFLVSGINMVSVITCGFVLYYVVKLVERIVELREGVLCDVVGDARPEFVPDSEGPDDYWLHIGGLKLDITKAAYAAFRSGGPYRIYYVGDTNTVVGGEVLPDWRPLPRPRPAKRHWWQNVSIGVE